jgi:hypothetical protein
MRNSSWVVIFVSLFGAILVAVTLVFYVRKEVPLPPPRLGWNACHAHVKSAAIDEGHIDWRQWGNKAKTQQLVEKSFATVKTTMRAFVSVYETNVWGKGSGAGSAPAIAANTICMLTQLIEMLHVTLIIDSPCGDQQWAPILRQLNPNLKYIGVDIVPAVIARNLELHSRPQRVDFMLFDLLEPKLYQKIRTNNKLWQDDDVVLILMRHTLEHNLVPDTRAILTNVKKSGAPYFVGTNMPNVCKQGVVPHTGGYASINYQMEPFSLPHPIMEWWEGGMTYMALWKSNEIPEYVV